VPAAHQVKGATATKAPKPTRAQPKGAVAGRQLTFTP
jgi:hypothetical protein